MSSMQVLVILLSAAIPTFALQMSKFVDTSDAPHVTDDNGKTWKACTSQQKAGVVKYANVKYTKNKVFLERMNVFVPKCGKAPNGGWPVVILVHGLGQDRKTLGHWCEDYFTVGKYGQKRFCTSIDYVWEPSDASLKNLEEVVSYLDINYDVWNINPDYKTVIGYSNGGILAGFLQFVPGMGAQIAGTILVAGADVRHAKEPCAADMSPVMMLHAKDDWPMKYEPAVPNLETKLINTCNVSVTLFSFDPKYKDFKGNGHAVYKWDNFFQETTKFMDGLMPKTVEPAPKVEPSPKPKAAKRSKPRPKPKQAKRSKPTPKPAPKPAPKAEPAACESWCTPEKYEWKSCLGCKGPCEPWCTPQNINEEWAKCLGCKKVGLLQSHEIQQQNLSTTEVDSEMMPQRFLEGKSKDMRNGGDKVASFTRTESEDHPTLPYCHHVCYELTFRWSNKCKYKVSEAFPLGPCTGCKECSSAAISIILDYARGKMKEVDPLMAQEADIATTKLSDRLDELGMIDDMD